MKAAQLLPSDISIKGGQRVGHVPKVNAIPHTGVYLPTFQGITGPVVNTAGNGAIAARLRYADILARQGAKYVDEQQEQYDQMEISDEVATTNQKLAEADREYWEQDNSGKGYTEYITGKYEDLANESLNRASNTKVRTALYNMYTYKGTSIQNNAFIKEKETYTAYVFNKQEPIMNSILNRAKESPESADSLALEGEQALSPILMQVSPGERAKIESEWKNKFTYAVALGQIDKNPEFGLEAVGRLAEEGNLTPQQVDRLQRTAKAVIKDQEREEKLRQMEFKLAFKEQQHAIKGNIELRIALGEEVKEEEILNCPFFDDHTCAELIKSLKVGRKAVDRKAEIDEYLLDNLNNNKVGDGIVNGVPVTDDDMNKAFARLYTSRVNEEEKNGNHYTLENFVNELNLKPNAIVYPIQFIKNTVERRLLHSTDEGEVLESARIIASNHDTTMLKGMDDDTYISAMFILGEFNASGNIRNVISARNSIMSKLADNKMFEKDFQNTALASSNPQTRMRAYDELISDLGWEHIKGTPTETAFRSDLYKFVKGAYKITGNEAEMKNLLVNLFKPFMRPTLINNNEHEIMYKGPNKVGLLDSAMMANESRGRIAEFYNKEKGQKINPDDIVFMPLPKRPDVYGAFLRKGRYHNEFITKAGKQAVVREGDLYIPLTDDTDIDPIFSIKITPETALKFDTETEIENARSKTLKAIKRGTRATYFRPYKWQQIFDEVNTIE